MKDISIIVYIVFTILGVVIFSSCTPAQPKSTYKLTWQSESNSAKYYIFYEEGTSSLASTYTLKDGMDYKTGTTGFLIDSVNAPTVQYFVNNVANDGKYIVVGIVGVGADGLYGPMGVSAPFKKPTVPTKIVVLPIIRIP